jgi:hypothetical protein
VPQAAIFIDGAAGYLHPRGRAIPALRDRIFGPRRPSRDFFGTWPIRRTHDEEQSMDTMTACEAAARYPVHAPQAPRRVHATTVVTALYVAFVLGAPGIVRFAPDLDAHWLSAVTVGRPQIRCASIASAPSPCEGFTVAAAGSVAPAH